jgi:hypothetical protein
MVQEIKPQRPDTLNSRATPPSVHSTGGEIAPSSLSNTHTADYDKAVIHNYAQLRRDGVAYLNELRELGASDAQFFQAVETIRRSRPEIFCTYRELPTHMVWDD